MKRVTFTITEEEYSALENQMFNEKNRSVSAFIRKCIKFYLKEKQNGGKV